MNILIFGAGAVGSLLGGFLAKSGHDVSLLGRSAHLDAIRKHGLQIKGIWGTHVVKSFSLYSSVRDLASHEFDLIVVTVKSFDTEKAVSEIVPLMKNSTMLLSFQNGLGNIEAILRKVRPEQYLVGRIITGVDLVPGQIEVTVSADALAIGKVPGTKPIRSPEFFADLCNQSKIPARAVANIETLIWSKVIYNCALNGLCSVLEIPYGKMLDRQERMESMRKIVEECYEVGKAKKIALAPATAKEYFDLLIKELIPKTAAHYPSMLRDLHKGRRTEIDSLNGAVYRFGGELNIPTPENKRITDLIHKKETASAK